MIGGLTMKFHHFGVTVNHLEEALDFFKSHLGFEEESRFVFMGEEIVFLTLGDFRIELVSSQEEHELNIHICIEVNKLTDLMAQSKSFRKIEGPYKLDNGWQTIFYKGPNQEIIEFLQIVSD